MTHTRVEVIAFAVLYFGYLRACVAWEGRSKRRLRRHPGGGWRH